ncbi:hypothetical protein SASPL_104077 [Salvia splendens]|uniref:Uncharacterized protein n=1 Tax=Salvia splendens TaxID=180675 RepID=A0A8X8YM47_SALSN|nr:uncharacterized protein LOC121762835 [Salvia splendens]KAG6432500.1 hypothetical protein SASPL_104077 [Salvia splendens]
MAYRRKQGAMSRSSTFKEEKNPPPPPDDGEWAAASSLAAAASAAHRNSTGGPTYDYTAMGSSNETGSFWGVLARKAKAILEDDDIKSRPHLLQSPTQKRLDSPKAPPPTQTEISKKLDTPTPSHAAIAYSTRSNIAKTLDDGGESKGPETPKIQIVRKGNNLGQEMGEHHKSTTPQVPKNPTTQEDLLKASRDVAMATAAKAKLLLRELKTVKADLTFTKQRCTQLEEENRILRHNGPAHHDDDMIRNQLETLLAEKARLAHENSVYARENRVLREIVEYHQLTTQDVIYVDEGSDEVAEVHPILYSASLPDSPTSPPDLSSLFRSASATAHLRFDP